MLGTKIDIEVFTMTFRLQGKSVCGKTGRPIDVYVRIYNLHWCWSDFRTTLLRAEGTLKVSRFDDMLAMAEF